MYNEIVQRFGWRRYINAVHLPFPAGQSCSSGPLCPCVVASVKMYFLSDVSGSPHSHSPVNASLFFALLMSLSRSLSFSLSPSALQPCMWSRGPQLRLHFPVNGPKCPACHQRQAGQSTWFRVPCSRAERGTLSSSVLLLLSYHLSVLRGGRCSVSAQLLTNTNLQKASVLKVTVANQAQVFFSPLTWCGAAFWNK